jgi:hypothetical protein
MMEVAISNGFGIKRFKTVKAQKRYGKRDSFNFFE